MASQKYSLETRLAIVNHYLSGKDGATRTTDFLALKKHLSVAGLGLGNYTRTVAKFAMR